MGSKSKPADDDLIDDEVDWESDGSDSDDSDALAAAALANGPRQRDWRDLERYKEERELKRLMEDDLWLDDL